MGWGPVSEVTLILERIGRESAAVTLQPTALGQ
jgi:hypothetical protein